MSTKKGNEDGVSEHETYTKLIGLLEERGARFRIYRPSATCWRWCPVTGGWISVR